MPNYWVISPPYEVHYNETGCDAVLVEAHNRREAKVKGLREIRKQGTNYFNWVLGEPVKECPFKFLKVEEETDEEAALASEYPTGQEVKDEP